MPAAGDSINLEDHGCEGASVDTQGLHRVLKEYLVEHEGRIHKGFRHNDECASCNGSAG